MKMTNGEIEEGRMVLRAKIDMASSNMHFRDPIIYRVVNHPHHRTGDKWKVYPMYDFAHGQSDYFEGVTHSLCTLEFVPHRPLYDLKAVQVAVEDLIQECFIICHRFGLVMIQMQLKDFIFSMEQVLHIQ